jgi:hypothetical protein
VIFALPAVVVVTVNVTLPAPAGIVTDEGTRATVELLLLSDTAAPPVGAAPFKVRVPMEDVPWVTVDGFKVTEMRDAGVTVSVVVLATPRVAVSVTIGEDDTPVVVIVKVRLVEPADTVTLAGT